MSTDPLQADVDVLIPAYNVERTVEEAISSVSRQTLMSLRIIVVDDGSTDNTPKILDALKTRDPRIEIVRKENGGIVDALNLGLARCTARYLARFDADDISYPDRLKTQVAYLDDNDDCVAVAGRVDHIDVDGRPLYGLPHPGSPDLADMTSAPAMEPYLIHPFLMVRRAAIASVGGYRYVHNSEDSDLYWRLAERGKLHNLDVVLGKYRVHSASISSSSIINSRVMSISSQLGAISAQRRRAGVEDLSFRKDALAAYKSARTLEGMWALASEALTGEESSYLRTAASIKLLELAGYRPINLEISDCSFIRSSLHSYAGLTAENKKQIDWYITTTAARLCRKGHFREMTALLPIGSYPIASARLLRSYLHASKS